MRSNPTADGRGERRGSHTHTERAGIVVTCRFQERTASERLEEKERYVPRGISAPPLVVDRAEGARIWDVDGEDLHRLRRWARVLQHGARAAGRRRGHPRAGGPLPSPVPSSACTSRTSTCRRSPSSSRRRGAEDAARQLRRRGARERGQDRARLHRPPGRRRLRARLPRPHAAHDDDDEQARLQEGHGAVRPEVYRAPGPYPYRGSTPRRRSAASRNALQERRRSRVGRLRRARAGTGRGRVHRDAGGLSCSAGECATGTGSSTSTTRCSRASAAPARSSRSSTGSRAGPDDDRQVDRGRAAGGVTGARRSWTPCIPEASAAPSAATPSRAQPRRRCSRPCRGRVQGSFGGARHADPRRLDEIAGRVDTVGEVRPRLDARSSSSRTARPRPPASASPRQRSRQRASAASSCSPAASTRNVIRILVPIVIDDEDLAQGLDILEESLVSSGSRGERLGPAGQGCPAAPWHEVTERELHPGGVLERVEARRLSPASESVERVAQHERALDRSRVHPAERQGVSRRPKGATRRRRRAEAPPAPVRRDTRCPDARSCAAGRRRAGRRERDGASSSSRSPSPRPRSRFRTAARRGLAARRRGRRGSHFGLRPALAEAVVVQPYRVGRSDTSNTDTCVPSTRPSSVASCPTPMSSPSPIGCK